MDKQETYTSGSTKLRESYSESYKSVRTDAELRWPAWKVSTYNSNVAVSAHAKKLASKE